MAGILCADVKIIAMVRFPAKDEGTRSVGRCVASQFKRVG
jgi:hypothetical protein